MNKALVFAVAKQESVKFCHHVRLRLGAASIDPAAQSHILFLSVCLLSVCLSVSLSVCLSHSTFYARQMQYQLLPLHHARAFALPVHMPFNDTCTLLCLSVKFMNAEISDHFQKAICQKHSSTCQLCCYCRSD